MRSNFFLHFNYHFIKFAISLLFELSNFLLHIRKINLFHHIPILLSILTSFSGFIINIINLSPNLISLLMYFFNSIFGFFKVNLSLIFKVFKILMINIFGKLIFNFMNMFNILSSFDLKLLKIIITNKFI